jgi:hypothetical protein
MKCTHKWTIRFPTIDGLDGSFEFTPYSLTLRIKRSKYDYCRAEADTTVGDMMAPETRYRGGRLRGPQPVHICLNGSPVRVLYFKPDFAEYLDNATHLEFHDVQETLDSGVVDFQQGSITLKEAYRRAFEQRESDTADIIKGLKFTVPDELATELVGQSYIEPYSGGQRGGQAAADRIQDIESSDTKRLVESNYAVNFDQVSPIKAIWTLNQKFNVQSWIGPDQYLWVGVPESSSTRYIATQNDDRVWHYNNVNVRHPREPIQQVTIDGAWIDNPDHDAGDTITNFFKDKGDKTPGNVRAQGIAKRTDIDTGRTLTRTVSNAKRNAAAKVAMMVLRQEMKKQHSGTVELNPEAGGKLDSFTELTIGDQLHIVPDDRPYSDDDNITAKTGALPDWYRKRAQGAFTDACGSPPINEVYLVDGIRHTVSGSEYTVTVNVSMFPYDVPVESKLRYFNPQSEDWLDEDEVFGST